MNDPRLQDESPDLDGPEAPLPLNDPVVLLVVTFTFSTWFESTAKAWLDQQTKKAAKTTKSQSFLLMTILLMLDNDTSILHYDMPLKYIILSY